MVQFFVKLSVIMLSVTICIIMLSVVMLNVGVLSNCQTGVSQENAIASKLPGTELSIKLYQLILT